MLTTFAKAVFLASLAICAPLIARAQPAPPADSATVGQPGTLVRATPLEGGPVGASAFRILYRSTGLNGESILVSGMAVIPPGAPPPGGRPIIAWAHPTSGVVPRCAPSLARKRFQFISGLKDFMQLGYVVVATDYPGLGTPQTHPYLVGVSEARAVLDSVRAARLLPGAHASRRFVVWGHSQGGHAALFTGLLAASYAPDLNLVGVAAAAPASELAALLDADLDRPAGQNIAAMTLWSWSRVYDAPMDQVLQPAAIPVVNRLAKACIESIYDVVVRGQITRPLRRHFLAEPNFAQLQPWAGLLAANTPGALPHSIPIFLAQGSKDQVVPPPVTLDYMKRLCAGGSAVALDLLPGVGHAFVAEKAAGAASAWMADRFAGRPAPSDCGRNVGGLAKLSVPGRDRL